MIEDSEISVIICCYNSPFQKLLKTLISVLNQKEVRFDVTITDDGSKNGEFVQIEKWIEENNICNVSLNCNKENRGTIQNILSAIPFCKSNYVKLISPGDYLYDEHSLKNYLDCFKKDNATIVTGKSVYYDLNNKIIPTPFPKLKQTKDEKFTKRNIIAYGDSILGASLAYEKQFLVDNLNNISSTIKYVEDYPLISICLLKGLKLTFSDDILVWYECGSGISTSKKVNPLFVKDFDEMLIYLSNNFDDQTVKYRVKRTEKYKAWPKMKRRLLYLFVFPGYFCFLVKSKIFRAPYYESDITKKDMITTWNFSDTKKG